MALKKLRNLCFLDFFVQDAGNPSFFRVLAVLRVVFETLVNNAAETLEIREFSAFRTENPVKHVYFQVLCAKCLQLRSLGFWQSYRDCFTMLSHNQQAHAK